VVTVEGYPPSHESARVQFDRDRDDLRREGIDIEMSGQGEDARYRIDPSSYYLPDLGLTDDEAVALNLAASRVRLDGHDPDEALLKLGQFGAEGPALVALPSDPRLAQLHAALRHKSLVRFAYGGVERDVEPWGVLCRDGYWYIAGLDRSRPGRKTFRVDHIEGDVTVGERGAFAVPADFVLAEALPVEPYEMAPGDPIEVDVWLDAVMGPRAAGDVIERRGDGSVVVRLRVASIPGLRSWLLGMRDHARVVAPDAVVDEIRVWLRSIVEAAG
jgi:predicted DNA-binding transcriptional regulator YafY